MQMTFRWFGQADAVTLKRIRQIPGVDGIVTSLFDVPVGSVWPADRIASVREDVERAGFRLSVIESIPVHEDIKLGRPTRDRWIDHYCQSLANVGAAGVPVVCYNFMPIFDWMRTDLAMRMADDAVTVAYDHAALERMDLSRGMPALTAWVTSYDGPTLAPLLAAYRSLDREALWANLAYFLERVAPAAEAARVRLGLHPDDPPWDMFGVPRIITGGAALERVVSLSASPANGITFCTGSLGTLAANDLPSMIRALGSRVHFMHCRNVRTTGDRAFYESAHPSRFGDVPMLQVMEALRDIGFRGPMRPDHGRMIWDETGRPASGLYDRALAATYLQGLWEGVTGGGEK
jgi:mannonate dehydratase